MTPATITTEAGHVWWLCPNCRQKLAEIIGSRVVIVARERRISIATTHEPDQVCWRCGVTSQLNSTADVGACDGLGMGERSMGRAA